MQAAGKKKENRKKKEMMRRTLVATRAEDFSERVKHWALNGRENHCVLLE
jgi:hypothetical protein